MNVSAREDTSPFSVNDTHILHSARSEVKELDQMSSIEVKNHMRSSNIQFRETEDLCQTCIEEGEMLRTARKWGPYGGVPEEECLIRYGMTRARFAERIVQISIHYRGTPSGGGGCARCRDPRRRAQQPTSSLS